MAFKMKAAAEGPFKKNFPSAFKDKKEVNRSITVGGKTRTTTKKLVKDEDGNPVWVKDVVVKDKHGEIIKKKTKKDHKRGKKDSKVKVKAGKNWDDKDKKVTYIKGAGRRKEKKHVFKPYSDEKRKFQKTGEVPDSEFWN